MRVPRGKAEKLSLDAESSASIHRRSCLVECRARANIRSYRTCDAISTMKVTSRNARQRVAVACTPSTMTSRVTGAHRRHPHPHARHLHRRPAGRAIMIGAALIGTIDYRPLVVTTSIICLAGVLPLLLDTEQAAPRDQSHPKQARRDRSRVGSLGRKARHDRMSE